MADWKDKRRVMQHYDLTSEMYEERYAREQKAKYEAALENVDVSGGVFLDVGTCLKTLLMWVLSPGKSIWFSDVRFLGLFSHWLLDAELDCS